MKAHLIGGAGLMAGLLLSGCQKSEQGEVTYTDPYVKETIANNTSTAGYITLVNNKTSDIQLIAVSVAPDVAAKAELHGHKMEGDIMKMHEVASLDLPSGTPVKLEPGGYHVMLMGLKQPLIPASEVNVTFQFSDGESLNVAMPVKK
ncbi:copper chaperone PCu(A)C [Candidatus Sororendozoicomonas aggregata]|uniref:copper chaperone PCu(A)C n=1 Tax=Candidatus Sororendozoicomonas aggregata TaxID=3073239 RepID=UPI002ED59A75